MRIDEPVTEKLHKVMADDSKKCSKTATNWLSPETTVCLRANTNFWGVKGVAGYYTTLPARVRS